MTHHRLLPALLLCIVTVALLPGFAGGETFVSVTATTDPVQPAADEEFAVDVQFDRPSSDSGPQEVDDVVVYRIDRFGSETELERTDPNAYVTAGQSTTVSVDGVEVNETGVHRLRVDATLVDSDGVERTVSTPLSVGVHGPDPLVEVDAADAVTGAWRPVNVTVANGLNESIRSVSVAPASENVTFRQSERVTASVPGGERFSAVFDARTDAAGVFPVEVAVEYEDPEGDVRTLTRTADVDFTAPDDAGEIQLTGVNARSAAGGVEISGSAANVGSDAVEGVVVAVDGDAPGVEPAQPQPEYFVGGVEGSEFASFTVNAAVTGNESEVPLTVTYTVDGVEQTTTRTVAVDTAQQNDPQPPAAAESGSGLGALPILGVVLLLALVGAAWYFRN